MSRLAGSTTVGGWLGQVALTKQAPNMRRKHASFRLSAAEIVMAWQCSVCMIAGAGQEMAPLPGDGTAARETTGTLQVAAGGLLWCPLASPSSCYAACTARMRLQVREVAMRTLLAGTPQEPLSQVG
jgi:hypothetical protein